MPSPHSLPVKVFTVRCTNIASSSRCHCNCCGVGRGLFAYAVKLCRANDAELRCITVNASVNSVWSYEAMGFRWTDEERVENGIRYVPMELAL